MSKSLITLIAAPTKNFHSLQSSIFDSPASGEVWRLPDFLKIKPILTILLITLFTQNAQAAPKVQEITSANNLKSWIIEDHYLPIVSMKIAFTKSGFAHDPKNKLGLAFIVSSLLDEGAGGISSLEFRKTLEELATDLSFSTDEDNFYVTLTTLSQNLPSSLELLNLALTKPDFDPAAIERIRNQILVIIEKKKEDPEYVAMQKFRQTLFDNHPYGNPKYGNKEDIKQITRDDLLEFVTNNFTKKNVVISVVGDIQPDAYNKLLDIKISLPNNENKNSDRQKRKTNNAGRSINIVRNIPQSVVIFGSTGLKRNEEDFYAYYVMNHILGGGGFESRLMNKVREENGLAYTVYSYIDLLHNAGIFTGYVATDKKRVDRSIKLIKQQIAKMADYGTTEEELQDAKDYLINSFPLKMTKNSHLASFLTTMQTENLGIDFLDKRNEYVNDVSLEQVTTVAKKMLKTDEMIFATVGQ